MTTPERAEALDLNYEIDCAMQEHMGQIDAGLSRAIARRLAATLARAAQPSGDVRAEALVPIIEQWWAVAFPQGPYFRFDVARLADMLADHLSRAAQGAPLRCHVTGNPVGTDTWTVGQPCACPNCKLYIASSASGGEASAAREALVHIANRDFGPRPAYIRTAEEGWLWALCRAEDIARAALAEIGRMRGPA